MFMLFMSSYVALHNIIKLYIFNITIFKMASLMRGSKLANHAHLKFVKFSGKYIFFKIQTGLMEISDKISLNVEDILEESFYSLNPIKVKLTVDLLA